MEQIFFLVLVAVVGLLRWVLQSAEDKRNKEAAKRAQQQQPQQAPVPNAPVERAPAQTEEERIRRFMEALGVPTTTTPPAKTPPRRVTPKTPRPPKRKIAPVDPFPTGRPATWKPEPVVIVTPPVPPMPPPVVVATPPPLPETPIPQTTLPVSTAPQPAAPVFEVVVDPQREQMTVPAAVTEGAGVVRPKVVALSQSWRARLSSVEGVRDAIILREIFGPPRSMQSFEEFRAI